MFGCNGIRNGSQRLSTHAYKSFQSSAVSGRGLRAASFKSGGAHEPRVAAAAANARAPRCESAPETAAASGAAVRCESEPETASALPSSSDASDVAVAAPDHNSILCLRLRGTWSRATRGAFELLAHAQGHFKLMGRAQ